MGQSCDKAPPIWAVLYTRRVYQGHEAGLWAVAVHGGSIYTAANDATVRRWALDLTDDAGGFGQWIWDLRPEGQEENESEWAALARLLGIGGMEPISAAISPDASRIATPIIPP